MTDLSMATIRRRQKVYRPINRISKEKKNNETNCFIIISR